MGAFENFMGAARRGDTGGLAEAPHAVQVLTLTWFESAADGIHVSRSTNTQIIADMDHIAFETVPLACKAVADKAVALGIDKRYVVFPQLLPPTR